MPVLFILDSGIEHLHGSFAPGGFRADHQVQIVLLRPYIAIGGSDGDLAKDRLNDRDPFRSVAFTDRNQPVGFLNCERFDAVFESNARFAADFSAHENVLFARSSLRIAGDALAEAMLGGRISIVAPSGVVLVARELIFIHLADAHREVAVADAARAADMAVDRNVVRRIRADQIDDFIAEKRGIGVRVARISAEKLMTPEQPKVSWPRNRGSVMPIGGEMRHARELVRFPAADLDNSALRSHILVKRCVKIACS
jgi:hypothetical protein